MLADDAREGGNDTFQLGLTMNSTIWLALALVLVLEGLGRCFIRAPAQNGRQPEPATG